MKRSAGQTLLPPMRSGPVLPGIAPVLALLETCTPLTKSRSVAPS